MPRRTSTTIERYSRGTRWFHAGVYLTVLVTLATGWWFLIDGYRHESPLARLTGLPDGTSHEYAGYGLGLVMVVWLARGARGLGAFVRETARYRPGDGRWLRALPRAMFTGRFGDHDGHFDPGQRLANVAMLVTLATLLLSGLGMVLLPSRRLSLLLFTVHHWSALLATPVIVGHIIVAAGVLPGYRGVWRSMHLGGRLPIEVARRIWPAWLDANRNRR
jgi:cytochrome b subunit of formate dehydrogenase